MAAGWTTLSIKDAAGNSRTMRVWAEDTTSGPYSFGQVLADGSGSSSLSKTEDSAAVSGDAGLVLLAVRRDVAANSVSADGDYSTLSVDGTGQLRVTSSGSITSSVNGDVAHDASDSGNPVKVGWKATTALSGITLVSDGDRTDGRAGVDGVQITRPHCNLEDIVTGNATDTSGNSTSCIAAQGAGVKTYLVSVVLCNTSATAITVDIKDGSTVKTSLPLPAGSGCVYNPSIPIPGTANTAWNFDGSAAATTVTCSMVGFKSKV
ncbi:hypothetical protein [Bradyrhizobium elkanii]|uniref:hypothetical protein n=1 Tax=Bradyrhizobium elkanii TaxID=29448 RepID=UPI002729D406|nr:hypothetical protein [Bradyrhizobium elkanii]WLA80275.1 hypothetical protein QNJ99_33555 [Bradyrhizobium elkanii]